MDLNVGDDDGFLKQLQKKKKKVRSFNQAISRDSTKEVSHEERSEYLEKESEQLAKDTDLELIDTIIVKKKSNVSTLNQRYRDFESSSPTTVSDYDSQKLAKSVKRKFNYIENKEHVKKPVVIDLEAKTVSIIDSNKKMNPETPAMTSASSKTHKAIQQAKPAPDLYFGLFETVKFFANEDNSNNLLKPVLNNELEIVTTDVPSSTLKTLFEHVDVATLPLDKKEQPPFST